ncbi:MAG TPA: SDR family oxidoreductase [Polyangia bacterium]|nr:SDR family oxidoreductase [Polyangia bacterium]
MTLDGRVAVVTGGGRGIGRATVLAFVQEGARVAFCARTKAEVQKVAREAGPGHLGLWDVDVARGEDVAAFARNVVEELGVPDVLVCNAGVALRAPLEQTDEAAWDLVLGVNLRGTYVCVRAFLPGMRARANGRIVCVSSIAGRQGTAGSVAYCAAKHGVVGFVRALAEELRGDGLQVNAVCPGSVDTAMLAPEFAPGMPPEEVARTIVWLAGQAPDSLTGACIDQFG